MGIDVDLAGPLGTLREQADACETARRLTPEAVAALRETGVFRMAFGRRLGGPERDPLDQIELLEAISAADASAGWCAMIGSDGGYATARLEESVAKEMYPDLDVATALNANPSGQAKRVDGGFEVSGQWPFGSGATHSQWLFLHAIVTDADGGMTFAADGLPTMRMVAVAATDAAIVDTWTTTGLAGSGSHDIAVRGVFVPEERTYSLFEDHAVDASPLYSHAWMFFVNIGAVPLGLGRAAIDEAIRAANAKFDMRAGRTAAEDPIVEVAVARAEALVGSARAYLFDTVGTLWDTINAGGDVGASWVRFRIATTNAFHATKDAVTLLYESLGTSGVYRTSVLDRHYRDIATMTQHVLTQPKTMVPAGRALLGLDPQDFTFDG